MKVNGLLKALKELRIETAEELFDNVLGRMDMIDAGRKKYQNKALEKHFEENILPILAFYLELKDQRQENALELSENVANKMYGIGRKRMEFFGRFPFFYWLIQSLTPNMMKLSFPEEGWDIEWVEVSKRQIAFNMHGCFYHNVISEYNAPELTPIFCGLDDLIYDKVSPHMRWERKGTIGRGDSHCDFRFINAKSE